MASLYSLELEKQFLSGTILAPSSRAETSYITPADLSTTNRVVLSAIDACLAGDTAFSTFLLVDRLASLGIKIADSIEPAAYIKALEGLAVGDKAVVGIAKQLKRTTIRRKLYEVGQRLMKATEKDDGKKAGEMVAEATAIFNGQVNILSGGDQKEPIDLYGTIRTFLTRDNSVSSRAIASPFPLFNDFYGYMDVGSVYLLCSRMKIGKSSWWLSMGQQLAEADSDDTLRILVLDTELEGWENHSRSLSAISGVSEFRIRQGWYRKRKDETEKVEAAADFLEPFKERVHHIYCGGMEMDEMCSVARRWAYKQLREGKRGLIVYDYLKLNSQADFQNDQSLSIRIGGKMDTLKRLSKELHVPVMAFAQTNRENVDSKGGARQQNSAVVGGSDMLAQFASNIYLLEELTPEERAAWGQLERGQATHSLREIACRQRGPCELGENKLVPYKDGKATRYTKNYLLYSFDQFHVREVGTFRQIMERQQSLGIQVAPQPAPDIAADRPLL